MGQERDKGMVEKGRDGLMVVRMVEWKGSNGWMGGKDGLMVGKEWLDGKEGMVGW